MKPKISIILSFMMFLQYYIWGSWYVTMGTYMSVYLKSTGIQIGAVYSALAIATMISPFFIGMVADRFFSAQRLMGFLHLAGGLLLFLASRIQSNTAFYWIILSLFPGIYAHHWPVEQRGIPANDRSGQTISGGQGIRNAGMGCSRIS